jgi:hypothetical protein
MGQGRGGFSLLCPGLRCAAGCSVSTEHQEETNENAFGIYPDRIGNWFCRAQEQDAVDPKVRQQIEAVTKRRIML